ncbi:hypothetical protein AcW1_001572 [Taiwanofungus camphoratus]|nr:hypothetical protein AcV7_003581 [Antrodia cinnamomea]KAI0945325.1 hypothetical protein AcW1_001572 [Antrodia cinnamomea]
MLAALLCPRISRLCKYYPKTKRLFHSTPSCLSQPGTHMNWSASVLSTVTSDTEPTIVVTFDSGKYIFNVGENTSRIWLQSRRHWRKARGVFLTSIGTQRCSGLPVLIHCLTSYRSADVLRGCPYSEYGSCRTAWLDALSGVHACLSLAVRSYYRLELLRSCELNWYSVTMCLTPTEVSSSPSTPIIDEKPPHVYKDENITVYAIPVYPSSFKAEVQDMSNSAGDSAPDDEHVAVVPAKRKRSLSPSLSSKRPATADEKDVAICPDQTSEDNSEKSETLGFLSQIRNPGFSPATLRGEEAQEWRRLTVKNMFPYDAPKPEPAIAYTAKEEQEPKREKQKKKQKKGRKGAESEASDSGPTNAPNEPLPHPSSPPPPLPKYNVVHPHRDRRLPSFGYPSDDASSPVKPTLSYVVVGPRPRGKFDAQKADALGLKPGPLRGKLTKGETVTFTVDDGKGNKVTRVVRPEDCVGPSENPQVMIVLDVPTPAYIHELTTSFATSPFFARLHSKSESDRNDFGVHLVVHICGEGVLEDARYKAFMNGFADDTHHLIASREHGPDRATLTSAAYTQLRLHQLDPGMFPMIKFRSTPRRDLATISGLPAKVALLASNTLIDIRPPRDPCHDELAQAYDHFHPAVASGSSVSLPASLTQKFSIAKARVQNCASNVAIAHKPGDNIVVVPLGTSSASPSKYRNVSSTLLQIPDWGNILLDAGEGTWGQIVRLFGDDVNFRSTGVWDVLRDLKCIFVSHMHGDHHIGLAKILAMRTLMNPQPSQPLYVVGVRHILVYLREQSELEDLGLNRADGNGVITVLADSLNWRTPRPYAGRTMQEEEPFMDEQANRSAARDMCYTLGLESFTTVDVVHKTRCYGAVIKHKDAWSIVLVVSSWQGLLSLTPSTAVILPTQAQRITSCELAEMLHCSFMRQLWQMTRKRWRTTKPTARLARLWTLEGG